VKSNNEKKTKKKKMKLLSQIVHCFGLGKGSARVSSSKVINLIVLGVEESGKTTMCLQLHGNLEKGTTPTTGLSKFSPLRVQGYDVVLHDMGGRDGCRKMWKSYFANIHGLVYVVDAAKKNFDAEVEALRETAKHPQIKGKPVLILANKHDLPDSRFAVRIKKNLKLNSIFGKDDSYLICECVANDSRLGTIRHAIEWIASTIDRDFEKLNNRVVTDTKDQEMKDDEEAKQRHEKVDKIKEKRKLALEAAEADNPDGKIIQICLECDEAVATKKDKKSSFRPVCDKCYEKLVVIYKKKTSGIKCILCGDQAVKKSGKVGWKPVCKSCNDRLNAGESKEDILASPEKKKKKEEEEEEASSAKKEEIPKKKKEESKKNNDVDIVGSYCTGNGETEHVRLNLKTSRLEVFSEDSEDAWGSVEFNKTRTKIIITASDDEAKFTGTLKMGSEPLLVTWCDGDTWTMKKKKKKKKKNKNNNKKKKELVVLTATPKKSSSSSSNNSSLKKLVGRWRTNANTYEIVRPSMKQNNALELFHEALDGSADEIMWATLSQNDDEGIDLSLKTKEDETYRGKRQGKKIVWSDGDSWTLVSDESKLLKVEGTYETAEGDLEHLCRTSGNSYDIFHNDSKEVWSRIDQISETALRLVILADNSSCDGKIEKSGSTTCITWSDGDKWIRKDKPSSPVKVVRRCSPESKTPCNAP